MNLHLDRPTATNSRFNRLSGLCETTGGKHGMCYGEAKTGSLSFWSLKTFLLWLTSDPMMKRLQRVVYVRTLICVLSFYLFVFLCEQRGCWGRSCTSDSRFRPAICFCFREHQDVDVPLAVTEAGLRYDEMVKKPTVWCGEEALWLPLIACKIRRTGSAAEKSGPGD